MNPDELTGYIHRNIPLTKAMELRVLKVSPYEIEVVVPIEPNLNHKKTVFGGSLHCATTVACWGLLYVNTAPGHEIVITHSEIDYIKPVNEDFLVKSWVSQESLENYHHALQRKGRGRIELDALIGNSEDPWVKFRGVYATIRN